MRKAKASERLEDSNIKEVIALLEKDTPITKKEACAKLNIAYNTKRLESIIVEYKERIEREAKIRRSLRSKPLDFNEKKEIIESYLGDTPISEIAKTTFRTVSIIKKLLSQYHIPLRQRGEVNYHKPHLLEETSIREEYEHGDLVYSARYGCPAEIEKLFKDTNEHGKVYNIWLLGKEQQYAYQPYYELADLTKAQEEFGIRIPHTVGVMARPLVIK